MAIKKHLAPWKLVMASATVSAVLGVMTTLLAVGYWRQRELRAVAHEESALAKQAAVQALDEANRGNRARDEAEALVGFLLHDLSEELDLIGRNDLLTAAAEKTVAYFDSLPPELVTKESRDQLASVLVTLGQGLYVAGDLDAALASIDRAIALRRELAAGEDPEGEHTFFLGREISERALVQNAREDHAGARASYLEALRIFSAPPPRAIRDGHWEFGMATAHFGLGEVERWLKNYQEALAAYANSDRHLQNALHQQPEKVGWIKKRMNLQNNSGVARMYLTNFKEAETNYLQAVETARTLVRLEPANRVWEKELGTALMNVGTCLDEQEDYARAEPFIREGLKIRQGLVDWDPKNARNVRSLAHAWHNLSSLQFNTHQPTNALASCRRAMSVYRRLLLLDPENERWIEDMQQAAAKYRDRLSAAGLKKEALILIEEAAFFAQSVRSGHPRGDAWDDLLAGFYDDIRDLGGEISPNTLVNSAQQSLVARALSVDLAPEDTDVLYDWATACLRLGESHTQANQPAAALVCAQLTRWVLRESIPPGYRSRDWILAQSERAAQAAAIAIQRIPAPKPLIAAGSTWRYWDRAESPGSNWNQPAFDDRSWRSGPSPLGYGESDLESIIDYGSESRHKHMTAWFRHAFELTDRESMDTIQFNLRRDDGAAVYLNGQEIIRDYLPEGVIQPDTAASMTAGDEEKVFHIFSFAAGELPFVKGTNVLAVEVHQNEPQSSDLAFDLELLANVVARDPTEDLMWSEVDRILGDAVPKTIQASLQTHHTSRP